MEIQNKMVITRVSINAQVQILTFQKTLFLIT